MNNIEKTYKQIQKDFQAQSEPCLVKKYAKYFKEGYDAYGLANGIIEKEAITIRERESINFNETMSLCKMLIGSGKYEETFLAYALLKYFQKDFSEKTFGEISKWFEIGITNWAECDVLCGDILPNFVLNKIVKIDDFSSWIISEKKYKRRAVPVTFIKVLKTVENINPLLRFVEPLMEDKERVVHQGMGWFLREAWKKDPQKVEKLLFKWKNTAPRLIIQYATEKMMKGEKLKYRKEKARP